MLISERIILRSKRTKKPSKFLKPGWKKASTNKELNYFGDEAGKSELPGDLSLDICNTISYSYIIYTT